MTASTGLKRLLLVNAVVWSPGYAASSPHRDVVHWYSRWLADISGIALTSISAEADVLADVRAGVDAVIISGSPRDAWNDDPVNLRLCEVIAACRDRSIAMLGVCYGHQLLGRALGGVVGPHPQGLELGNTEVELTSAGRQSPLFSGIPDRFEVLSSHADAVLEMPSACELLARGAFTLNQGFHYKNQLFGVQFHPETDPATLQFIWSMRRDTWRPKVSFDLDQRLDRLQPTPMAGNVLRNFVTKVVP